ncbi:hypothetical protein BK816_03045 [Boudabousia tangfeifanii]|uniref:Single-stranded DNA-binding protein n=1 Tax=Boudabousia tangfeifanii TaxID=1912795 RepID=A0A1D9MJD3_9ACTO|nr:single-stranded DNA-binding protein [Boudabousia tangfeifanii]AOZ72396.1 hypothetical protein BK816_03045 [Boudabousia tangfeifanii]
MTSMTTFVRGHLGSSPEMFSVKEEGRSPGVRFRLAVTESYRDAQGEWKQRETQWMTVKAWGSLAQNVFASLKKGDPVVVMGRSALESWTNSDGQERSALVVTASSAGLDLARCTALKTASIQELTRAQAEKLGEINSSPFNSSNYEGNISIEDPQGALNSDKQEEKGSLEEPSLNGDEAPF